MQRSIDEGFVTKEIEDILIVSHNPVELVDRIGEKWTTATKKIISHEN